jgi:DNA-binding Lrp family transcriptional regulator
MIDKKKKVNQQFIKNLTGKTKFVISKNSRALRISRQTYQSKLDYMRKEKIINSFTININPNIHPIGLKYVMIEIKTNPKEPELVNKLLLIPQLRILDGIIGDFSLFGLFVFKSMQEYHRVLNKVDEIMAGSYFKKYQIIETIKVFKTNGISLTNLEISYDVGKKIDLEKIARKFPTLKFNPHKFPGILMNFEDPKAKCLIFSSGKIVVTDFDSNLDLDTLKNKTLIEMKRIGINITNLDEIDYFILKILQDEQGLKPISTYEIKDILNEKFKLDLKNLNKDDISQSTIHNRIKKLENQGAILNYTINFSPKKVGFNGKYYLRIKPKDPSKYNELADKLVKNKEITDLFRIGEQYGLFAIIRVEDIEDYSTFIRNLYISEEIEDTYTNFVLDELIPYSNFLIF